MVPGAGLSWIQSVAACAVAARSGGRLALGVLLRGCNAACGGMPRFRPSAAPCRGVGRGVPCPPVPPVGGRFAPAAVGTPRPTPLASAQLVVERARPKRPAAPPLGRHPPRISLCSTGQSRRSRCLEKPWPPQKALQTKTPSWSDRSGVTRKGSPQHPNRMLRKGPQGGRGPLPWPRARAENRPASPRERGPPSDSFILLALP